MLLFLLETLLVTGGCMHFGCMKLLVLWVLADALVVACAGAAFTSAASRQRNVSVIGLRL